MLKLKIEKGFKKDIKRDKKSEKYLQLDFEILKDIIKRLQEKKPINTIHDIHPLHRPLRGYEAIHIKSDWILVFKIEEPFLILVMLGIHSQVYEKCANPVIG